MFKNGSNNSILILETLEPNVLIKILKAYGGFSSTREMAEALDVSIGAISGVEAGKEPCGYLLMESLIAYFDLNGRTLDRTVEAYNREVRAKNQKQRQLKSKSLLEVG